MKEKRQRSIEYRFSVFPQIITDQLKDADENTKITNDWKFAAMVIDRMCLIIFTLFTIIATITVLFSAPHIIVTWFRKPGSRRTQRYEADDEDSRYTITTIAKKRRILSAVTTLLLRQPCDVLSSVSKSYFFVTLVKTFRRLFIEGRRTETCNIIIAIVQASSVTLGWI